MVENGFAALAVMAQIWENDMSEELEEKESSQNFLSGQATIGRAFSDLLQQAWLAPMHISVSLGLLLLDNRLTKLHFLAYSAVQSVIL